MEGVVKTGKELGLLKSTEVPLLNAINFPEPLTEDSMKFLKELVGGKQDEYILVFIKLLNNVTSDTSVAFLLYYLTILFENTPFIEAFASIGKRCENVDPIAPFLALLKKPSIQVIEKNYCVLGALLSVSDPEEQERPIQMLVDACIRYLTSGKQEEIVIAVHTLTLLLRSPSIRSTYTTKNGIPLLTKLILSNANDVQLIYEIGFCLWMLSYNDASIVVLLKHNAIALIHDILRVAKKEKCTRVAILTLKNFARLQSRQHGFRASEDEEDSVPTVDLEGNRLNIFGDMISLGLLRTLQLMSRRNYGDPDILPEVDGLLQLLEKNIEDTTSFADYKQEVLSGRLDWTPVHKSEKFWKENIKEFEKDDYKILRELAQILKNESSNTKTLTIVCHDLGEFVKYHPQGRKILNQVDVKGRLLVLMSNDNQEVSKQALLCVQKIMVQKWEFLAA
eukprot:GGOE01049206.1.p1 GENE.GGOE01049206.1~~GGOE01049206.1.p1  ORF type:complete len:461 (+),score=135.90 GGOE01049206.1:35-1384(+)